MDLNGIGALVTGGASGLGEATARELAGRGARVTLADLNEEKGEALASELGGGFVLADVTDEEQVRGRRSRRPTGCASRSPARASAGPSERSSATVRPRSHPSRPLCAST